MLPDKVPFEPECEVFYEGESNTKKLFDECTKNPGHPTFIPVNDITLGHLPEEYRTERVLTNIKRFCDRTVKLNVSFISPKRPDCYPDTVCQYPYSKLKGSGRVARTGTGFIEYGVPPVTRGKPCPCPSCKTSDDPEMEYLEVKVQTAAHVVFDDSEAESTVCELFYDSEDERGKVKYLYGISGGAGCGGGARFGAGGFARPSRGRSASATVSHGGDEKFEKCTRDKFTIKCVTHDKELFDILPVLYNRQEYGRVPTMIISHPHGCSKRITFGNILNHTSPLPPCHVPGVSKYTIGRDVKFRFSDNAVNVSRLSSSVHFVEDDDTTNEECVRRMEWEDYDDNQSKLSRESEALQSSENCFCSASSEFDSHTPEMVAYYSSTYEQNGQHQFSPTGCDTNCTSALHFMQSDLSPFIHSTQIHKETASSSSSSSSSSSLLNPETQFRPGIDYPIREKMTLTLPCDATYFCRCPPCKGDYDPCSEIVEFPPGTTFTLGESEDVFLLPEGVEFNVEADRERFGLRYFPYHVIYDMDTCPGCSGALVVDENYMDFRLSWMHCGSSDDGNRSGCYFAVYSMGWC